MHIFIIIRLIFCFFLFLVVFDSCLSQQTSVFQAVLAFSFYIEKAWHFLMIIVLGSIGMKNVYSAGFCHDQNGNLDIWKLFLCFIIEVIPIIIGVFGMYYCYVNPLDLEIPFKYYFDKFFRIAFFISFIVFIYVLLRF